VSPPRATAYAARAKPTDRKFLLVYVPGGSLSLNKRKSNREAVDGRLHVAGGGEVILDFRFWIDKNGKQNTLTQGREAAKVRKDVKQFLARFSPRLSPALREELVDFFTTS